MIKIISNGRIRLNLYFFRVYLWRPLPGDRNPLFGKWNESDGYTCLRHKNRLFVVQVSWGGEP